MRAAGAGGVERIGVGAAFLCEGDPVAVDLSAEICDGAEVVMALDVAFGGGLCEIVDDWREGIDKDPGDAKPVERTAQPVILPFASCDVLAVAADELQDGMRPERAVAGQGRFYFQQKPIVYGNGGVV